MFVRERQHVIDDVVPCSTFREVVHSRDIEQHFEIEGRIVFERTQYLLRVLAFHRNGKIPSKLADADGLVRKLFLESSCDRSFNLLVFVEEHHKRSRRSGKVVDRGIDFWRLELSLPRMPFI